MSSEAIYVQHLIAVLHTDERSYSLDVVEYQQEGEEQEESGYRTHQGPLNSGGYLHIQSFNAIFQQIVRYWNISRDVLNRSSLALEIRVVAIYGSEDMPTGAWRTFRLDLSAAPAHQLVPHSIDTHRMSSRRQRKQVLEWAKAIEMHKVY
ncbi:hypothetical protein GCM10022228_18820 [Halomonas cibimaris]|uniref:DUF3037 domain-containing protein n=1 Tax=Halomonas cibimaris TaxID=657012 RepID=A0ABP7LW70_9GAMM